jgi:murein DD-endopeptidase MepM/ murein hydrolase activator NlpD
MVQMDAVNQTLSARGSSGADLSATLSTVSAALAEAAAARDAAAGDRVALQQQIAELEMRERVNSRRQDEMIDELEQAVALSFGPLEKMFARSRLDVDGLIETVRAGYSGQGGPEGKVAVSTRSFDDPGLGPRFDRLMLDLDRMNLMRIAATKLPYAVPVRSSFRFTSGFGYRHDPKGRGTRNHAGIDLAAPRGTAIFATAEGVVTSAKYESGYGNVVRIRHGFGFETVYAHQSRMRVRPGQEVSRGEQIGDMGSTGRSTGSHLHYEVRVNGQPVNPMIYLEAAKDVF